MVKVCGVTRPDDARLAVELGASHVGCVLAADSPRRASHRAILAVAEAVAGQAQPVLVSRSCRAEEVLDASTATGVRHVQVHGVSEGFHSMMADFGLTSYRVYSLPPDARELPDLDPQPTAAQPAVVDVGRGGSGRAFPWELLGGRAPAFAFIAGGITPENVKDLLRHRPWGIDLSSGVESAPGVKDEARLRALFGALQEAS